MQYSTFIGRLYFRVGVSSENWYSTRLNKSKIRSLLGVQYCYDMSPSVNGYRLSYVELTVPFCILSVGLLLRRRND